MLEGINPLLTGALLLRLDEMGHSDAVVVVDAHFPAASLGRHVIDLPGTSAPEVVAAIREVFPLDDAPAVDVMESADGEVVEAQREIMAAAGTTTDTTRFVERFAYYEAARGAFLIVRTGETRKYGNALLRKGVVGHPSA